MLHLCVRLLVASVGCAYIYIYCSSTYVFRQLFAWRPANYITGTCHPYNRCNSNTTQRSHTPAAPAMHFPVKSYTQQSGGIFIFIYSIYIYIYTVYNDECVCANIKRYSMYTITYIYISLCRDHAIAILQRVRIFAIRSAGGLVYCTRNFVDLVGY